MHELWQKRKWFLREDVGATQLHESYRLHDGETHGLLATALEEADLSIRFQKLFFDKAFLPLNLSVRDLDGRVILTLEQPRSLFCPTLTARDGEGRVLARFRQTFGLWPRIEMVAEDGRPLGRLAGDWRARHFQALDASENTIGSIEHQFGGVVRELFTTADDYLIQLCGDQANAPLLIAGALVVDTLFHEV
jgi:uncharacterized protein YxjI